MCEQSTMLFSFVSYCVVAVLRRQKIRQILSSPVVVCCTSEQPVQTQRRPGNTSVLWLNDIVQMVTHPSTNRAQRRATTLIKTNTLSLSQATIWFWQTVSITLTFHNI